jgi:hypothetical protein
MILDQSRGLGALAFDSRSQSEATRGLIREAQAPEGVEPLLRITRCGHDVATLRGVS